ncbi:hypothetical protein Bca4012_022410 [Brassica carinata]|uniref:Uncharacterized protein n=1 Tax=Brassica carinata TaxID=52824 RepID=A0A8X7TID5_BRACI|nr:hypothetical protein Bca52824_095295 [Brassica carinata]
MAKAELISAIAKEKAAQIVKMAEADLNKLPIQKEIDMLQTLFEGIHQDSMLELVLSSLPEEARSSGTDTVQQLNQKLKGTLRHFSLIPPGGGGILAHSLAHIASWLKVDNCLAEGKLAEAAAALEEGVKGSKAEEIVNEWVRCARNRAISEQAVTLLQSYATCASLT